MVSPSEIRLLLDTNIISLFFKANDTRKALYAPDLHGKLLTVSFVTIGELYKWTIQKRWGPKKLHDLEVRLNQLIRLPYHDAVARQWAQLQASSQPLPDNDAWIAACAQVYDCTLVTDDKRLLAVPGLRVINHPW
jgi:predicted nucleic acid-binding protein